MAKSPKTGSAELGELIRSRREHLGMSRRQLVDATGLSYPYVSQLETGYRSPSSTALRELAEALQISTDEIVAVLPDERSGSGRTARPTGSGRTAPGSGWMSNPAYRDVAPAAPPTAQGRRGEPTAVDEAVDLLSSLPPGQRLDALATVQRALLAGLVDEEVRRTGRDG